MQIEFLNHLIWVKNTAESVNINSVIEYLWIEPEKLIVFKLVDSEYNNWLLFLMLLFSHRKCL